MNRILCALTAGLVATSFTSLTSAQDVDTCGDYNDCNECTGPTAADKDGEGSGCLWCLNRRDDGVPLVDLLVGSPAGAPGQCAKTCPVVPDLTEAEKGQLGIKKTNVQLVDNPKYSLDTQFTGLSVAQVNIDLRRGDSTTFKIKLKKGPVEFKLYFLLDLSDSMNDVFKAVGNSAGGSLPTAFDNSQPANTPPNQDIKPKPFLYGFGSYVDKAIPPFTFDRFLWNPQFKDQDGNLSPRSPTYGFRNQISFTDNAALFQDAFNTIRLSGNDDSPEGGLEALIQALYCTNYIQWDDAGNDPDIRSLRLVLMATDQVSHVAGDGIEAGLVWPAETKCNSQFFFSENSDSQKTISQLFNPIEVVELCNNDKGVGCVFHDPIHDYPSIKQVEKALIDRQATVAFAVPGQNEAKSPGVRDWYQSVANELQTRGVLTSDKISSNEADMNFDAIVRKTYYDVFDAVPVFTSTESDEGFDTYYRIGSIQTGETACTVVTEGGITATVNDRPPIALLYECEFAVSAKTDLETGAIISTDQELSQIQTSGSWGQFTLKIKSSACRCPSANYYAALPKILNNGTAVDEFKCNANGNLNDDVCGTCQCLPGVQGRYCNCNFEKRWEKCPPAPNGLECGGATQGKCVCGICECIPPNRGVSCSCNDKCGEEDPNLRCGGNGKCECDECDCDAGFTGKRCECDTKAACLNPVTLLECSGPDRGTCNKNEKTFDAAGNAKGCECDCIPPYEGQFCEICSEELSRQIPDGPDKVYCGDDQYCRPQKTCDSCFGVEPPPESEWNVAEQGSLCQWCPGSKECYTREVLKTAVEGDLPLCKNVEGDYNILEKIEECPQPPPPDLTGAIVGPLAGLLALILLAILLWRLLAHLKDKKEWEAYENDKAKSKWQADNNPIFKPSVSEFENPIFE